MFRCCCEPSVDLLPCYASALVAGPRTLEEAVVLAEEGPITPCVTAWCQRCRRHSLLVHHAGDFPCFSAFAAHALALHGMLSRDSK